MFYDSMARRATMVNIWVGKHMHRYETSGQDGSVGRYTLPPCTTKRTTTHLKTRK